MRKIIFTTFIFLMTAALTARSMYLRNFPYMRTAKLVGTPEKIAAIPLDHKLYKNTNDKYTNIRLIDEEGRNIPFAVKNVFPLHDKHLYAVYSGTMSDFKLDIPRKTASAEFSISPEGNISRLTFPAMKNEQGREISLDFFNAKGEKVAEKKNILLKQSKHDDRSVYTEFPAVKAQRVRVTLTEPDQERLSAAKEFFKRIAINQAVPLKTPGEPEVKNITLPEISRFNKGQLTEITVDANRIPCTELFLQNDDKKFERYVEVFSKTKEQEKCIASQNLTQDTKGIPLPEIRGDYYVIRIYNANKEPLKNLKLLWEIKQKVLMFIPPEKGNVKIYYGGDDKMMPYDIEFADQYGLPPQIYELGEEVESPDYAPKIPAINLYKYFLWVVIAIGAVLLFIMIIRMMNKAQNSESYRNGAK